MAPATSLTRVRKRMLDLVAKGALSVVEACRHPGISRSRYHELRARYLAYDEARLLPKPRSPPGRSVGWSPALADQIIAYAINHPTEGPAPSSRRSPCLATPVYREAGIELVEVVVDGGPEFKGKFKRTCRACGSPCTGAHPDRRTSTRSWRLFQGTVLHLHYRPAFRYRFYTSARDIDDDVQTWVRCATTSSGPHGGYRTKGRRPAEMSTPMPPRSS